MDILLVDGYNIIGAWPELRKLKDQDLALARDILISRMAEYQAYTGYKVIVVFDAHLTQGIETKYKNHRVEVIYTRENETADERIEKLAISLSDIRTQIHVATSDFAEQWAIFGQGALRKSARELLNESDAIEARIKKRVTKFTNEKPSKRIELDNEISAIFEKWRRGQR